MRHLKNSLNWNQDSLLFCVSSLGAPIFEQRHCYEHKNGTRAVRNNDNIIRLDK